MITEINDLQRQAMLLITRCQIPYMVLGQNDVRYKWINSEAEKLYNHINEQIESYTLQLSERKKK